MLISVNLLLRKSIAMERSNNAQISLYREFEELMQIAKSITGYDCEIGNSNRDLSIEKFIEIENLQKDKVFYFIRIDTYNITDSKEEKSLDAFNEFFKRNYSLFSDRLYFESPYDALEKLKIAWNNWNNHYSTDLKNKLLEEYKIY